MSLRINEAVSHGTVIQLRCVDIDTGRAVNIVGDWRPMVSLVEAWIDAGKPLVEYDGNHTVTLCEE